MLRLLMQRWLRDAAREAVLKQATAGAEPVDLGCEIGFVFAMGMEAAGLLDQLGEARHVRGDGFRATVGTLAGRRVGLVVTGMRRDAARRGTLALVEGHRPRWVISAGYSGGLQPQAKLGDIVLAERVVDGAGEAIDVDLRIDRQSARQSGLHVGSLVTVDELVCEPADKADLGRRHEALAVDMESYAVAAACRERGTPFLAVRIVSDDVESRLPPFLDQYSHQKSLSGKAGVVLGALAKRPSNFKTMYKMREESLMLSDRLARFLTSLVRELSPGTDAELPTR